MLENSAEGPALSIVVPVYNGAATVGELVKALRALGIEGGLEIVLVVDGSPDNSIDVCKELVSPAGRADYTDQSQSQFRRAQRRHGRVSPGRGAPSPSPWTTICRTRPSRGPSACSSMRATAGYDAVYTYYAEKKHAPWRNLGQPLHQLVRRPAARQAARSLPLELSLHLTPSCASASWRATTGPFPYVDGLVFQVTQNVEPPRSSITCRATKGQLQLHDAPADPAVAGDVPQFLGDAAQARHPVRAGVRRPGRDRGRHHHRRGDHLRPCRRKAGRR